MKYTPAPLCSYSRLFDKFCVNAYQKELDYLYRLDVSRLLYCFYEQAGLPTPECEGPYGGWEQAEIKGHTMGHYLTALCQAQQSEGGLWLFDRIDRILQGLADCQREDGFLFASPETLFDRLEQGKPAWVPWYTMHKLLEGLCTACETPGHHTRAIDLARKLGDWIAARVLSWDEATRARVLSVEYGGMNDALYHLYQLTGDARYAKAAHQFDETALFERLAAGEDVLNGRHANTTIPKLIGALRRYTALGERSEDELYLRAAENFWDMVVNHHTYVTGGNSEWEHFGPADILDEERTACNCETCNSYNMLKLSQQLFAVKGDAKYLEFYQWTYYNAILPSQNTETGMTTYFQPMATGFFKTFSTPFDSFWCCTGTGMESFTKLAEGSCYLTGEENEDILICRYQNSHIDWMDHQVRMYSDLPRTGRVEIRMERVPEGGCTLYLFVPNWCAGLPTVYLNRKPFPLDKIPQSRLLALPVKQRSQVLMEFPMQVQAHFLPDNENAVAFSYGPVVLSAELGEEDMRCESVGVNVCVATRQVPVPDYLLVRSRSHWLAGLSQGLVQEKKDSLRFRLHGTNLDEQLVFTPYLGQQDCRGGIYFYLFEPDCPALTRHLIAQRKKAREYRCEVDALPIGNDQYELLHQVQGEKTKAGSDYFENYRQAARDGWFSYCMKLPQQPCFLRFLVLAEEGAENLRVTANGAPLPIQVLSPHEGDVFLTCCCAIPEALFLAEDEATFRFSPQGEESCRIFGRLSVSTYYDKDPSPWLIRVRGAVLKPAFMPQQSSYTLTPIRGEAASIQVSPHYDTGLAFLQNVLLAPGEVRPMEWRPGETWEITCLAEDHHTAQRITLKVDGTPQEDDDRQKKENPFAGFSQEQLRAELKKVFRGED